MYSKFDDWATSSVRDEELKEETDAHFKVGRWIFLFFYFKKKETIVDLDG